MRSRLARYRKNNPLALRLAGAVLLVSALTTLLTLALFMAREYRQGNERIANNLKHIQITALPGLSRSLWNFDEEQLQVQLEALLRLPEIHSATVHWQDWNDEPRTLSLESRSEPSRATDKYHDYPLVLRRSDGSQQQLGTLVLGLSHQQIYQRAGDRVLFVVGFHILQALLITALILLLLRQLITTRLSALADYTRRLSLATLHRPAPSREQAEYPDELDDIASALNTMRETLLEDIRQRQQSEQALLHERELRLSQEQQQARTENANQTKDALIATLGQHIRTPLNGLLAVLDLLTETRLDEQQRHYLSLLLQSGENLQAISNDILDYSRLESGQLTLQQQPVDLLVLLEQCSTHFSEMAHEKQLQLICDLRLSRLRWIQGDGGRLRQIFLNLIGNAVKFTGNGQVLIRAWETRNRQNRWVLRVEVEDSGAGISAQQQQRIFEPFIQGQDSPLADSNGSGLGLSVCRALCRLMKGTLGVNSEPGHGACFWVELPLQRDSQAVTTATTPPSKAAIKVLSNNPALRQALCQMLDWLGADSQPGDDLNALGDSDSATYILVDDALCGEPGQLQQLQRHASKVRLLSQYPGNFPELISLRKPVTQTALEALLQQPATQDALTTKRSAHWRFDHLRILVVVDNPLTRDVLSALFSSLRVETLICNSHQDALRSYQQSPDRYPLILVDNDISQQRCLPLCQQLRQQQQQARASSQILVLSSQTPPLDPGTAQAHGVDQILEKPLRKEALLQCLIEHGGGKRLDVLESRRRQDP